MRMGHSAGRPRISQPPTPGQMRIRASEILSTAQGLGPDLVWLDEAAVCNGGMVSQTVEMPAREVAEPFVFEMRHRSEDVVFGIDVYADRALRVVAPAGAEFVTQRFCLGEAAYGGSVEFRMGASERDSKCASETRGLIEIDRFSILPAKPGECPEPGSALNGEANPEEGGWWLDDEGVSPINGIATVALEPGVGREATGGARMYQDGGGNLVSMGTQISVPLPSSESFGPAFRFWWKGEGMEVFPAFGTPDNNRAVNALEISRETARNTSTRIACPHGRTVASSSSGSSGSARSMLATSSSMTSRSSPPTLSAEFRRTFSIRASTPRRTDGPATSTAAPTWRCPSKFAMMLRVAAPPAVARSPLATQEAAPTLSSTIGFGSRKRRWDSRQLWPSSSRLPANPVVQVAGLVSRNSSFTPADYLAAGVDWQRNEYCLPRGWSGRWLSFRVEVRPGPPPVQAFDPPKEVWLDDFQTTTSAGCPD